LAHLTPIPSVLAAVGWIGASLASGCGPAGDVPVQPLPPLERLSLEARYGLPEVKGLWRFAGWEVEPGDSTLLARSYPVFGALDIRVQRLDSIAGALAVTGGETPVTGEVRSDGWISLVTLAGAQATSFITGRFLRDTLWIEMTSVIPAENWPERAKGVFVRDSLAQGPDGRTGMIAWFRGTNPNAPAFLPDSLFADSLAMRGGVSIPGGLVPGVPFPAPAGGAGSGAGAASAGRGTGAGPAEAPPLAGTPINPEEPQGEPTSPSSPEPEPGSDARPSLSSPSAPSSPVPSSPVLSSPVPSPSGPAPAVPERDGGPRLLGEPVTSP
jgi:hypothetical protein